MTEISIESNAIKWSDIYRFCSQDLWSSILFGLEYLNENTGFFNTTNKLIFNTVN